MTLTDRYVAATLRSIPVDKRDDIDRELRASITDAVDARVESGSDPAEAEERVLTELGDPARLAAAIRAHGGEQLAQLPQPFATRVAGAAQVFLDPAALGGVEPVLEEVECGARIEMAIPCPVSLHGFLRWGGGVLRLDMLLSSIHQKCGVSPR